MSKMNELSLAVTEMRKCAEALIGVADSLTQLFSATEEPEKSPTKKKTANKEEKPEPKTITLEAVRAVLADKSRAGFTADIRALLQKHGADKLSEIDPANYAALLADAEVLGDG